jgi:hypothetical protein
MKFLVSLSMVELSYPVSWRERGLVDGNPFLMQIYTTFSPLFFVNNPPHSPEKFSSLMFHQNSFASLAQFI